MNQKLIDQQLLLLRFDMMFSVVSTQNDERERPRDGWGGERGKEETNKPKYVGDVFVFFFLNGRFFLVFFSRGKAIKST